MFTKIPSYIQPYVMRENECAYKAAARISFSEIYRIILVVDDTEKLVGILTPSDVSFSRFNQFGKYVTEHKDVTVGKICTRNFSFLTTEQDKYLYGTRMFVAGTLDAIPIVNDSGIPVEIFGRFQSFFLKYVNDNMHIRTHYAKAIGAAAQKAKVKGYDSISIIEFGVASGTGLKLAEIYAEEVSYMTGVKITVYGFDTGTGIPQLKDWRDHTNFFTEKQFQTDVNRLKASLRNAQLILGDICVTAKSFFAMSAPPPIGAMFIDVDVYQPTVAILEMLLEDDKWFLPEVYIYFDDIAPESEFTGEMLAIKEFNLKSENVKISPESVPTPTGSKGYSFMGSSVFTRYKTGSAGYMYGLERLKTCLRFSHPKFPQSPKPSHEIFIN